MASILREKGKTKGTEFFIQDKGREGGMKR